MGDVFKEQIVKRQGTFRDTLIKVCLWIFVFVLGFFATIYVGGSIGLIVLFAGGFGAKFLSGYLNVEYEYVLTNGEMDIDIIYDQSRRKRVFSAHVKQFELMAHIDDKNHEHSFGTAQVTRDFSSGVSGNNTYVFLTAKDGKKMKIVIEPNEKMLKAINSVIPRRNLHLRPGVVLTP